MELDNLNRELLNIVQSDFPVTIEPYKELAGILGTTEEDIISRLKILIDNGTIRRLGGIFDSRKLGYTGTLCAMKVPEGNIDFVAGIINGYSGITHNYVRNHEYNMWFTVLARGSEELDRILDEIKAKTGVENLINLPAVKMFKIKVNFELTEG